MPRHAHARSASCVVPPATCRHPHVPVPTVLSLASLTTLNLPPDCGDQQVGVVVGRSFGSDMHCGGGGVTAAAVVTVAVMLCCCLTPALLGHIFIMSFERD